jgi:hypothetical protein
VPESNSGKQLETDRGIGRDRSNQSFSHASTGKDNDSVSICSDAQSRAAARCRDGNGRRFTARQSFENNLCGTARSTARPSRPSKRQRAIENQ